MKTLNIYALYDTASSEYGLPFTASNELVAKRQTCITLSSLPIEYWKDFQLFLVGTYDCEEGQIQRLEDDPDNDLVYGHYLVCGGSELVKFFQNMYKENK